jgi:mRNA-degrading endonuclease RelE of RelBE toxin-antitoxin system
MPYEVLIETLADEELSEFRVYDQRHIVAEIEQQLTHQPTVATRRRKCLQNLTPSFPHVRPVWELRVGDVRVFYDVDGASQQVHVRSIRRKDPDQTTEEIV